MQRGSVGVKSIGSIRWPIPESPPYRHKNVADISHTSRVIANFVANFVAMATGVGRGKMRLAAFFDGPSPKTPYRCKKSRKYLTQAELQPILSQISLPWQPGSARGKIGLAVPKNHTLEPKSTTLSYTQSKL